jgi:hypothetical protein
MELLKLPWTLRAPFMLSFCSVKQDKSAKQSDLSYDRLAVVISYTDKICIVYVPFHTGLQKRNTHTGGVEVRVSYSHCSSFSLRATFLFTALRYAFRYGRMSISFVCRVYLLHCSYVLLVKTH